MLRSFFDLIPTLIKPEVHEIHLNLFYYHLSFTTYNLFPFINVMFIFNKNNTFELNCPIRRWIMIAQVIFYVFAISIKVVTDKGALEIVSIQFVLFCLLLFIAIEVKR